MISQETIGELETRNGRYLLGARMRRYKEVRDAVLARPGRYRVVQSPGTRAKDPAPLKVKEVDVEGRCYGVCLNEAQQRKDVADREARLAALREKLKQGDKALVGNRGYRKYLTSPGEKFAIDEAAVRREARFDGQWGLRTHTDLTSAEVALKYKPLGPSKTCSTHASRCWRPAPSSIAVTRRFGVTGSARSSPLSCLRNCRAAWKRAGNVSNGTTSCATWRPSPRPRSPLRASASDCAARPEAPAARSSRPWAWRYRRLSAVWRVPLRLDPHALLSSTPT
jgi:hypothetical protein